MKHMHFIGKLKLKKIMKIFVFIYIIYFLFFGIFIFNYKYPSEFETPFSESSSVYKEDKVMLLEDPIDSLRTRLQVIRSANDTIDLSYFYFRDGYSTDLILDELIKAANRGVKVRALFDGVMHGLRGSNLGALYLLVDHKNVEVVFYEKLRFYKPWVLQNRMHDKYLIVDDKYAIMGGRNISDRYFFPDLSDHFTYDRDMLVIRGSSTSVLDDINDYYSSLWYFEGNRELNYNIGPIRSHFLRKREVKIEESVAFIENKYQDFFKDLDIKDSLHSVEKIKLIFNPLQRFNKEPWVAYEINNLISKSDYALIKTPYVIVSDNILEQFYTFLENDVDVLTNSAKVSPNFFAIAGYLNNIENVINYVNSFYEYTGTHSIHGKSIIIDEDISVIGSFNFDPRSVFLSTESMLIVVSESFNLELRQATQVQINRSVNIKEQNSQELPFIRSVVINVLRRFLYFFTYML